MVAAPAIDVRFELIERVGSGSWGEVFRGRDRETGADVAIKKLLSHVADEVAVERFHREARLLARVSSEHVVGYVADGADEKGTPCLVVEWLVGEDLGKRQRRVPLAGAEILEVAGQITRGLAALHDAGIVHRDVKPSNVFLVEGARGLLVKLIDLGVARGHAEATLTTDGIAIGTPFYMSPEQARGSDQVGPASDLFSLGVVMFELASGKRPFRGDDLFAVLAKIVLADAPRLRDMMPGAPTELEALVTRAMAKEPAARFASASEMGEVIARVPPFRAATAPAPAGDADGDATRTVTGTAGLSASLEQRVVTGVFAKLPPSRDEAAPKRTFARIAEGAGGVPYALLGRNVVAVFGGRRTRGDEVARAARAALAVAEELVGARVAIATGRAVPDAGGLAGEVIERGAADLDRARPGGVHVDAITSRLLGEGFEVQELPGGARALVASRVAAGPARVAPPRTLLGKATPCVGRDRELAMLDALYAECVDESVARAALVTGAPGSGKSRLRLEFLARISARSGDDAPLVLYGRGDALAGASPFALLGGAIRRAAGALDAEPREAQRAKIAAMVERRVAAADAEAVTRGVCEIAGLASAEGAGDAIVAADRIRAAWDALLQAEARARPVVLVLEDLHAGDLPSVRLVDAALLSLASRPLLVVALARPEVTQRFPDLWAGRDVQRMPLPPLGKRAAERLVRAALGDAADEAVVARLVDRADGNAFFLEELIRAVAEHGAAAAMPDSVLGVVQARLDALGPDVKRLLRAASVFGDAFWRGGVMAVLGLGPRPKGSRSEARPWAGANDELEDLARREIVTRRATARFAGEEEYVFRHALVGEASYATLTDEDRALAHRLAAAWLEAAGERDAVTLAEHHERGDDADGARRHWLTAAQQALRGNDFDAAIARAARVSAAREGEGEDAGAALLVEAEAHRWRGDVATAAERAAQAVGCLTPASAPWFQAVREAIVANGRLARHDAVDAWARVASGVEAAAGAEGAQIGSLAPAAVYLTYAERDEASAEIAARVEALLPGAPGLDPVIHARVHQLRAVRAGYRLDTEGSLAGHAAALDAFTRGGDARNAALSSSNLGFVLGQLGELEAAEDALRRAHQVAERMRLETIGPFALHNLGLVLANQGRLEEARDTEARAVATFARQGDPRLEAASRVYLARIHLLLGDVEAAEREARAVLAAGAAATAQLGAQAVLSRALLSGRGAPSEALAAARAANDLLATTPVEEWEWESLARMTLVDALTAAGEGSAARALLVEAMDRLASRVASLRDRKLRVSAVSRIPEHARMLDVARRTGVPVPPALEGLA